MHKILIVYLIYLILNCLSIYFLGDSLFVLASIYIDNIYHMIPGVRCSTCAANGEESIVINGRTCPMRNRM
jgi:hypothetical protein